MTLICGEYYFGLSSSGNKRWSMCNEQHPTCMWCDAMRQSHAITIHCWSNRNADSKTLEAFSSEYFSFYFIFPDVRTLFLLTFGTLEWKFIAMLPTTSLITSMCVRSNESLTEERTMFSVCFKGKISSTHDIISSLITCDNDITIFSIQMDSFRCCTSSIWKTKRKEIHLNIYK